MDHPLFNGKTSVGMISGEAPRFPAQMSGHQALGEALKQAGIKHEERDGMYGMPEKSYMLYGPSREQMYQLGKQFGQESVIFSNGGHHELLYTNGPNAGKFHPAIDHEWFNEPPEDYYTHMPELNGYLRLNFDWDKLHPTNLSQDAAVQALHDRAAAQQGPPPVDQPVTKKEIALALAGTLRKMLEATRPPEHPLSYDWHNEHTDHHLHVMAPGAVLRGKNAPLAKHMPAHPHMDGSKPPEAQQPAAPAPKNDQAAGVGVSTYGKYAMPYGTVNKAEPADLFHYPYHNKNAEIDRLVKDHGYSVYYAGGKHGRPDLNARNYNTKHLMVYDPSPGSGGDFGTEAYTDGWRKIHELSHALVYPELNAQYGEGRRIGKLGNHRTLREAVRAVHWEWLAAHKQRELGEQIGVRVPDEVFNKELNTVMHDAIHRAVTGKFTEPSGEGFRPHGHKVPLEHALGMVREAAHNLGITGMHDLIKKNEDSMADEKTYSPAEWRSIMAKSLREKLGEFEKQMLDLRKAALRKSIDMSACPLCGQEDVPGKCRCLQGPLAKSMEKADHSRETKTKSKPASTDSKPTRTNFDRVPRNGSRPEKAKDPDDRWPQGVNPHGPGATGAAPQVKKSIPMTVGQQPAIKAELCKSCGKSHLNKCGLDEVKPGPSVKKGELPASEKIKTKAKEPVKAAPGNGAKVKPLNKVALPSVKAQAKQQGLIDASKAAAPKPSAAPAVKLPSPAEHAQRAATFADHMPAAPKPAGAPKPGVGGLTPPKLTGMAKIAAVGQQSLGKPPQPAAPKQPTLPMAKPRTPAAPTPALKAEKPASDDEPAPVKKAWPKDDAENDANALAFPSTNVGRDNFLETAPSNTKVTSHGARNPAAQLPNIKNGTAPMPSFMNTPAAAKGHVKGRIPSIQEMNDMALQSRSRFSTQGHLAPGVVEERMEPAVSDAADWIYGPGDLDYNPVKQIKPNPANKEVDRQYWTQIGKDSTEAALQKPKA